MIYLNILAKYSIIMGVKEDNFFACDHFIAEQCFAGLGTDR